MAQENQDLYFGLNIFFAVSRLQFRFVVCGFAVFIQGLLLPNHFFNSF